MSKYCGYIGFSNSVEVRPGVWKDEIVEKFYIGDLLKDYRKENSNDRIVNDISISNTISIIGDEFTHLHMINVKYVTYLGVKWTVTNFDLSQSPRIILYLGGVYNE